MAYKKKVTKSNLPTPLNRYQITYLDVEGVRGRKIRGDLVEKDNHLGIIREFGRKNGRRYAKVEITHRYQPPIASYLRLNAPETITVAAKELQRMALKPGRKRRGDR